MRKILLGAVGLLGFLVVWQLIPALGLVDPDYLPYPTDVFGRLAQEVRDLAFWRRVRLTMTSWAIGLTVATLAAVALGTVVGMVPFLRRATHTTVEFLRPVPSVALIPLAVLMFGLQMRAALVIIVYAAFWQVFVQVIYGVADVDSVARDTARSFGLTRAERLRYLILPTALPYLMTGLRLGAAVALILAVTAEMVIGNPGLGRMIELSRSAGDAVGLYGLVVVTGMLGLLVNVVFRFVERRSLAWHQSVLADEAAR
ncbi:MULTISPECIES: ABC transporter permease [Micromonospora]|uniref:ABC transporter permease n=1 Tax=Micromonospora TaxID=1873 RepID=UPI0003EED0A3|nr:MULTISPECIES: ABC transporter permease [Micromonospora]EWM62959.1 ABC transporter [Micromonospora sp. M42]MBC8988922.1 ABC transporter permease [Micromonospora chalcea]MBP1784205.1 ABC-type nitrate/sulfonate/bicarbonate transport system permease component [Micromonospora sp. HB375]MBQ1059198.1 ABC transporter permease [Micromonospora sp. C41]MBQ1065747.1 ABC transporter permease [Micromonospora sp. D75]